MSSECVGVSNRFDLAEFALSEDEDSEADAESIASADADSSLSCLASHDHKLNLAEAPCFIEVCLLCLTKPCTV